MNEHKARKRFGQNFLQDQNIILSIVQAIHPQVDDIVVEIGPGLAAITKPLVAHLNSLNVIEIDRDIISRLQQLPFANKLAIYQQDVLQFDFHKISGKKKIVGNLPYNISTPLLFKLTEYIDEIVDMHFMLQKEVVQRMVANEGDNHYGRLGVILQYFFEMEHLFDVPPTAFKPAPKVDSAVIRMIPNIGRIGIADNFHHFSDLVKQAFAMRRKTLRNNLKSQVSDQQFAQLDIDPGKRAETISPAQYVQLSNLLFNSRD